ncbi:ABC transporter permease subunit [Aquibacillus halophilus]|uniref:ABC transporter permease subunit n=1 Tax=Aquibacillus halophilus TaxID=930132 RepID=A0A6A8DKD4_9BACI|nr:ABC transporter permease [Aquibacillus halophilus]MRH41712.1 ABC transporter permease subunit [Aquibacillus halophilus]
MRPKTKKILFVFTTLVFMFFYIPIIILMAFSFNDSKVGTVWTGFTFKWYGSLFSNEAIINSVTNSLIIAVVTTLIATVFGTLAALAIHRYNFPGKQAINFLFYIPVVIPDIIVAVALLALYGWLDVTLGIATVFPGHVAITISYVMLVVIARMAGLDASLEEAAKDLGANEWQTFWKITFPLIFPGVLAGALLAFTISLDEFVISYFTTGPGSDTLPVLVYSMVRLGVSPEINALSTIMVLLIVIMVFATGRKMSVSK